MKIRVKLILLILGICALFGISASLYAILLAPVDRMEIEKTYFIQLADAINYQQTALNRLPFARMVGAREEFDATGKRVDDAFRNLNRITVLPTIDKQVKNAIEIIDNLKQLKDKQLLKLNGDYEAVKTDATGLFYFVDSFRIPQVYTSKFLPEKTPLVAVAEQHIETFLTDVEIMHSSLSASTDTISEQYSLIDREISAARSRALITAAIVVAIIIGLTICGALLFASGIAKSVVGIGRHIAHLKEGDLSERAELASRDEIGTLAGDLNRFLDEMSTSIFHIKEISSANLEAKDRLIDAANEATSSTTQIQASTMSISRQVESMDSRIMQSTESVEKILSGISDLNAQIEGQSAMVEEATASVTEMLSSLENMSRVTEKNRVSADDLVEEAERGRRVFETASVKIAEIPQNIGVIREMASVIQGIASRTNLLAMNAAIEAAHAGNAGRGFAVVADEIRKLSEASSKSSRDISESIKVIVAKIDEAAVANEGTSRAFAVIDGKIGEVSKAMVEIHGSIGEIELGSKQILAAMVDLQERSVTVKSGSKAMDDGSTEIRTMTEEISRISNEVASNIAEITKGIDDIGASIRAVGQFAEGVGMGSARLDGEVSRFKTARDRSSEA
jgi:methyl-accepting chemotaxis protein